MDIQLNTGSAVAEKVRSFQKRPKKVKKIKMKSSGGLNEGFSFTFTTNDKVKAVVARRKVIGKNTKTLQSSQALNKDLTIKSKKNSETRQNEGENTRIKKNANKFHNFRTLNTDTDMEYKEKNHVPHNVVESIDGYLKDSEEDKVKTVVARKKIIGKNAKKLKFSHTSNTNFGINSKKNVEAWQSDDEDIKGSVNKTHNFETPNTYMKFKESNEVPHEVEIANGPFLKHYEENVSLSLNVTSSPNTTILKKKKEKLGREGRHNLIRERKSSIKEHGPKVLTKEEIDEGIKKFSKLPTKKIQKKKPSENKINKTVIFKNVSETKVIGQRFVKPLTEKIFTGESISTVGLHPHSVKNLDDILNITELTKVQQMTIPRALEGRDLLVRSQTGSGKTLAYALPIVEKLQEIRPKLTRNSGIQAVIIVPTRELGVQTYELFIKLLKPFTWLVPGLLTGGEKRKAEKARLRKGINILIGTPGRLCDHLLHTESFKLNTTKWLILDEADRLLEMGYGRDVKIIVDAIKDQKMGNINTNIKNRNPFKSDTNINLENLEVVRNEKLEMQTLLLSATLTHAVQKLAGLTLKDPLFIDTRDEDSIGVSKEGDSYSGAVQEAVDDAKLIIPATIALSYILVPPKLRLVTLASLLAKECTKKSKALIFMSTMEMVNYHHDLINETLTQKILDEEDEEDASNAEGDDPLLLGVRFFQLHGSMTHQERCGVFKAFREAKSGVLLTTDVSGRGIDVPEVDLVIQYSPPQKIADFVHRVGRTARAGRSGRAVLFLGPSDTEFVRILEDNRIRISQGVMENYLKSLLEADTSAHNIQEAASNLQHKFEEVIDEDDEMREKACKAFVSWVRFYSTFPKELKHIFNSKNVHMGHYAKSFGLREPPTSFVKKHTRPKPLRPTNRLTYTERDSIKTEQKSSTKKRPNPFELGKSNKLNKFISKSISLSTSEYDSGLQPLKKKKRN